jgi:hypothetical protein
VSIRARIGRRALLALACSGALAGFALPAIASSLIAQERHQPPVRLLRAPPVPTSTSQAVSESPGPTGSRSDGRKPPLPLTLRQLERRARLADKATARVRLRAAKLQPPAASPQPTAPAPISSAAPIQTTSKTDKSPPSGSTGTGAKPTKSPNKSASAPHQATEQSTGGVEAHE